MWVLPVPLLPRASTFSRRLINSLRASSSASGAKLFASAGCFRLSEEIARHLAKADGSFCKQAIEALFGVITDRRKGCPYQFRVSPVWAMVLSHNGWVSDDNQ